MGNRARHDHDVERTMPYRLIGDIGVAAVRVARLGHTQISHGPPNLAHITLTTNLEQSCNRASSTRHNVRSGSKPEVELADVDFRFTPQSRHPAGGLACPKRADFVAEVG